MTYKETFPKFGNLDINLPPGFVDESSEDNAMPTFVKKLGNGNMLRLWIDFKDKARSKFPNDPRFCLSVYDKKFDRLHDDIRFEKWTETLICIRGLEEYHSINDPNR